MANDSANPQPSCFETPGATAQELYSTDDESTGQRCSAVREKQLQAEEKIISKHKSDSMFELRKLSLQHRPVSEFGSKHTLEEHLARKQVRPPQASINATESSNVGSAEEQRINAEQRGATAESTEGQQESTSSTESHSREPQAELAASQEGAMEVPPTPQWEQIQSDMQELQELRVVHGILQGPVHVEINQSLHNVMEQQRHGNRRPRPRPRPPRPVPAEESEDEMQAPVGRLLATAGGQSRRQRGTRGRRVRFRSQLPTPNADGRYSVPRRDQNIIVERLRQSPALNSLGEEARDEIVAEVGSLVSQQLVTSALSGDFRGVLEFHIQSRAEQMSRGIPNPMGQPNVRRHHGPQYSEDEQEAIPSAGIRDLREEMMIMKGQLNELKQMMRVSFDLQLDIQRAIRQEVSAALTAFLASGPDAAATSGAAVCPIPTLAQGNDFSHGARPHARVQVAESGHCVICSEGTIDSVIYHCGHMCTCMACGLEMKSKALKCPICRAPITDVIRAYASML